MLVIAIILFIQQSFLRHTRQLTGAMYSRHRQQTIPQPGKHKHYHSPKKPEWIKTEIIRLKALMPQAGCRTIAHICNRRYAASRKIRVGKTYVHQVLQHHDYEIKILRRKLKHKPPRALPKNRIWGVDLTGKTDLHGQCHFILGIIDHGTRALLYLQALHHKTSDSLIDCLVHTIRSHGKPDAIRTDNEAIFTSKIFRLKLNRLGIRHQRTSPACPW